MLLELQRRFTKVLDRYGMWLNLVGLVIISYFVLSAVLNTRWWSEHFRRTEATRVVVSAPDSWFSADSRPRIDEFNGWRLLGTVGSEDGQGVALMALAEGRRFLREGDKVGEWQVMSVSTGTLTFRSGSTLHVMALPGENLPYQARAPHTTRVNLSRRVALEVFPLLHWYEVPLGGRFVGMRLHPPVSPRNAGVFGFLEGDTMESVNGLPVMSGEVYERVAERFRTDDFVTLGVRRNGRRVYLHFTLVD